jgi:hypothetical protein
MAKIPCPEMLPQPRGRCKWPVAHAGTAERLARRYVHRLLGRRLRREEIIFLQASEVWHQLRSLLLRECSVLIYDPDFIEDELRGGEAIEAWLQRSLRESDPQRPIIDKAQREMLARYRRMVRLPAPQPS